MQWFQLSKMNGISNANGNILDSYLLWVTVHSVILTTEKIYKRLSTRKIKGINFLKNQVGLILLKIYKISEFHKHL